MLPLRLQVCERQSAAGLDFTQREAGVHVFHMRQIDQHLARKLAEAEAAKAKSLEEHEGNTQENLPIFLKERGDKLFRDGDLVGSNKVL